MMAVTVSCPRCGTANRIDPRKTASGLDPVCGRCRSPLTPPRAGVVEVDDARFDDVVLAAPVPVLLDVWARWCAPCRGMEPILADLARSLAGRVRVAKLDVDANPLAAARLRIQGVPTLVVFRDGREVTRMIGVRSRDDIMAALERSSATAV